MQEHFNADGGPTNVDGGKGSSDCDDNVTGRPGASAETDENDAKQKRRQQNRQAAARHRERCVPLQWNIVNEIDRVCTRRGIDVSRCCHDCVCVSKQSEAVPRRGRPTEEGDCRLEEGEGRADCTCFVVARQLCIARPLACVRASHARRRLLTHRNLCCHTRTHNTRAGKAAIQLERVHRQHNGVGSANLLAPTKAALLVCVEDRHERDIAVRDGACAKTEPELAAAPCFKYVQRER